jgi:2',3'-cyclic-nucleotide 2'-phosphodiesterase (5'-nucleotidase family)
MVLLDGGDILKVGQLIPEKTFETAVRAMDRMGYQAAVPGERELNLPVEVFRNAAASARFPFVCTNVVWPDGPVRPYALVDAGDLRVAVLAVVDPTLGEAARVPGARWIDPAEALTAALDEVRGRADLTVVVSHMGRPKSLELAERVPGLDVVIVSHALGVRQQADQVGSTLVVQAAYKGEYLGRLRIRWDKSARKRTDWNWEPLHLKDEVPEDPVFKAMTDEYLEALEAAKREQQSELAAERRRKWLQETSPEEFFKSLERGKVLKP